MGVAIAGLEAIAGVAAGTHTKADLARLGLGDEDLHRAARVASLAVDVDDDRGEVRGVLQGRLVAQQTLLAVGFAWFGRLVALEQPAVVVGQAGHLGRGAEAEGRARVDLDAQRALAFSGSITASLAVIAAAA